MNEIILGILMVAAILCVCGLYFKCVIMNWLAHDKVTPEDGPEAGHAPAAPAHHSAH
jgi:hypothetical protein